MPRARPSARTFPVSQSSSSRFPCSRSYAIEPFLLGSTLLVTKLIHSSTKPASRATLLALPTANASCISARKKPRSSGSAMIGPMGERRAAVLSSFSSHAKATLHELCRVLGLPGKPDGMTGTEVEKCYRDGHIRQIADYCESDVLNTYRLWLRHELFRGVLSEALFQASEANLIDFVKVRGSTKPHLVFLT